MAKYRAFPSIQCLTGLLNAGSHKARTTAKHSHSIDLKVRKKSKINIKLN